MFYLLWNGQNPQEENQNHRDIFVVLYSYFKTKANVVVVLLSLNEHELVGKIEVNEMQLFS